MKKIAPTILIALAVTFVLGADQIKAQNYSSWEDSLAAKDPGDERSLQFLLDSLGYNIDVENDELGLEVFCVSGSKNYARMSLEVAYAAPHTNSGYYQAGDTANRYQLFTGSNEPGDWVDFTVDGFNSIGFYIFPNIPEIGKYWYTETGFNSDSYDHALVFATGVPNQYLICWEDLPDGGDEDFQDLVLKVKLPNDPPEIFCPVSLAFFTQQEIDTICFEISASDPDNDSLSFEVITDGAFIDGQNVCVEVGQSGEYSVTIVATDPCGLSDTCTTLLDITNNSPPVCNLPPDSSTILLCSGYDTCLVIGALDPDDNLLGCSIIDGPGTIIDDTLWCYTPQGNETVSVTIQCVDSLGLECTGTFTVEYIIVQTPITVSVDTSDVYLCSFGQQFCVPLTINNSAESFEVLTDNGDFNSEDSTICMQADTSGRYCNRVIVTNDCGKADTVEYCIDVLVNSPPVAVCPEIDTILYCGPGFGIDICIPGFEYFDVDENIANVEVSFGQLHGDTLCFLVHDYDSVLTMIVTDSCGLADTCHTSINLKFNTPPVLTVPGNQEVYLCQPDTLCFDFTVSDVDGNFTYDEPNFYVPFGTIKDSQICFFADTSGTYRVLIAVSDDCLESDYDTFKVIVDINEAPVVTLPDDQQMTLCMPEILCFNYSVSDVETNIDSVWSNIGYLENGRVCFMADQAGEYLVIVSASDSCGAVGVDSFAVSVTLNQPPVVLLGDDYSVEFCGIDSVCVPFEVSDDNLTNVFSNYQIFDGQVCFTPDTSGQYLVWVQAMDNCDLTAADSIVITVTVPPPPFVEIGDELSAKICEPKEFCIDVATIENYASIEFNRVGYNPDTRQFCFTANSTILDLLTVTVTDSCGRTASDSLPVNIQFNTPPEITTAMPDTTIYLCQPNFVCLPLQFADSQNNITNISVNRGNYNNGQVCFVPYDSGTYTIIATATDSCGAMTSDTAYVTIITDQYVDLQCPNDTSIFKCTLDTLCFPIGDIPEWAEIQVSGINTWYDENTQSVCFYVECGVQNKIVVSAITGCDTISCDFTVNVECNQPPVVFLPQDTSIALCQVDSVYIPVGINDPNGNLQSVVFDDWLSYQPVTGKLSFYADTSGTYLVSVTVLDSCEAYASRQVAVTVTINDAPICVMPSDTSINLCQSELLTLTVYATDDSQNEPVCNVVNGVGEIVDGYWTYQASVTEELKVVVECIDDCEQVCRDSFYVNVYVNQPPICFLPSDTSITQCIPTQICLPISAEDPEGGLIAFTILSGPGSVSETVGNWCYTPTVDTSFVVVISSQDICGATCVDSFSITIDLNEAPIAYCPGDTSLFLCTLEPLYLTGFSASDPNGDDLIVNLSGGTLSGDTAYFTPQIGENILILSVLDNCQLSDACTTYVYVDTNSAPVCQLPNDTTITGCVDNQFCLPVSAFDVDENLIGCEIISGPGTLENGNWCYTPQASDSVTVTIRCTDECGAVCEGSFTVKFDAGSAPFITDQYFAFKSCTDNVTRNLYIESGNNPDDPTIFTLLSGSGSIDSLFGTISYLPDTPGVYTFVVEAANTCGANSATIYDTISVNRPPEIISYDTTIYLCSPDEVCFDVMAFDPDIDSLEIQLFQGPGVFTQLTDNSGQCCLIPADVDSATYLFVFQVTDLCPLDERAQYEYYYDTVTVKIFVDQPPVIEIPPYFSIFSCNSDSVCFDLPPFDPNDYPYSVDILSGNAMLYGDSMVCLFIDGTGDYLVSVAVTDSCGNSDTLESTIHVDVNTPPQVSLGQDFAVTGCTGGQVCFDFSVLDLDNNISDVFSNRGTVHGTDSVCFNADSSGVYMIVVTALDSCGAQGFDVINITVDINKPPMVSLADDFSTEVCSGDSICVPFEVSDDNLVDYFSNVEIVNGTVCFTADTSGQYLVWVSAIDSCEIVRADTTIITVTVPPPPFVEIGDDFRTLICQPTEFCFDVQTIENYASIEFNRVGYNPDTRQFCFTADGTILDLLTVTVTDSCGRAAYDSLPIYIQFNTAPEVAVPMPDTTVYLCQPSYICLPLQFADSQNNITNVTSSMGTYSDGQVCFVPYDSGTYRIIVAATDSCGASVADTAYVTVVTDQFVNLQCPHDTTVFNCELDTICFPIGDIPEWAQIQVSGINTWYDQNTQSVCFYVICGVKNKIVVRAITPCDTIKCSFTVDVRCNQPPIVFLPGDTTIVQCSFDSVYIPAGISDANGNLQSVTTSSGALYNPVLGKVSFLPDHEGVYTIQVTATDSCGKYDTEEILVNVRLNRKPEISFAPTDTSFSLCAPTEICLPVIVNDSDGNVISVTPSIGYYDSANQRVCFTPADSFGTYCITVIAEDFCGLKDTATQCITIESEGYVNIECPSAPIITSLCLADSVCTQVSIIGQPDSVSTSFGTLVDSRLCFYADTSGIYSIDVSVYSPCTTLVCSFEFDVTIYDSVIVSCPPDNSVIVCGTDTLYYPFYSENATEFSVTSPAFVTGDSIGLPVLQSGIYNLTLTASGPCGLDSCSFSVNATLNSAPVVIAIPDTTVSDCQLSEFCIPFTVSDVDNNITSVVGPGGPITGNEYCFTPTSSGQYRIIISAYDSCGQVGADTTTVWFIIAQADIICPGPQNKTICRNDSVRVVVPITPFEADVSVLLNGTLNGYYNRDSALVFVFPENPGSYSITVIAEAGCAVDTCIIPLTVNYLAVTEITCPSVIDTFLCPVEIDSICFPITVVGTNVQVTVSNGGKYSGGQVCVPVTQEGTFDFYIIGEGACGIDTCITTINIDADDPPQLYLPADTVIAMCDFDVSEICISGIFAVDDSDVTLTQICGPGSFQLITDDSGQICFTPVDSVYGTYVFCFDAADNCNSQIDSFIVQVVEGPECSMCATVSIDGGECIPVGRQQKVSINIESYQAIGGFEFLISYDATVMSFQLAQISGTAIDGWEYFTYRLNQGACTPACPSGLIRLLAIADVNNGSAHPPTGSLVPNGELVHMFFQISNDQNIGGMFLPLRFVTYSCGDNGISDISGNKLFVDNRIFNAEGLLYWDESNDVAYPDNIRPFGLGTSDSCIDENSKVQPKRCIDFYNGGVCILHPDSIDARGDINLNNIAYEVADVVVFTNYFIYGLSAFTVNVAGQIAASDINADGISLSVADLVLMLRIIIGDVPPIPKINPHEIALQLSNNFENGAMTVKEESVNGLGGAWLVYQFDATTTIGTPELANAASHMDFEYHVENNQLRMLIYSMEAGSIELGKKGLVRIPYDGNAPILVNSDFADKEGRPYLTASMNAVLPDGFELHQNYPNPFNPSTNISFSLESQSEWDLTIYNVAGKTVRKFTGTAQPGTVNIVWDGRNDSGREAASGVYFYRLEALGKVANRKMMLLK